MKRFKFRLQVVLEMRENELEKRRIEMAKVLAVLHQQEEELRNIISAKKQNEDEIEGLYESDTLDIQSLESHRAYGIKLTIDEQNQNRRIANTKAILEKKQEEVHEAHKKAEILKKLKERQEKEYYKAFLDAEIKETDDITTARFNR